MRHRRLIWNHKVGAPVGASTRPIGPLIEMKMINAIVVSLKRLLVVAVGLAAIGSLVGCGGGSSSSTPDDLIVGLPPEAVAVYDAFKDASASYKFPVEDALILIKSGAENPRAYADAIPSLQRLATNPSITPEQKQALDTLIAKLRSDLATAPRR